MNTSADRTHEGVLLRLKDASREMLIDISNQAEPGTQRGRRKTAIKLLNYVPAFEEVSLVCREFIGSKTTTSTSGVELNPSSSDIKKVMQAVVGDCDDTIVEMVGLAFTLGEKAEPSGSPSPTSRGSGRVLLLKPNDEKRSAVREPGSDNSLSAIPGELSVSLPSASKTSSKESGRVPCLKVNDKNHRRSLSQTNLDKAVSYLTDEPSASVRSTLRIPSRKSGVVSFSNTDDKNRTALRRPGSDKHISTFTVEAPGSLPSASKAPAKALDVVSPLEINNENREPLRHVDICKPIHTRAGVSLSEIPSTGYANIVTSPDQASTVYRGCPPQHVGSIFTEENQAGGRRQCQTSLSIVEPVKE
jgi:hypothetical protein